MFTLQTEFLEIWLMSNCVMKYHSYMNSFLVTMKMQTKLEQLECLRSEIPWDK